MVFIVGASCLYQAIEKSPSWLKKKIQISSFARPGLSFNLNTLSPNKNLKHLILRGNLQRGKELILWHDVFSNLLSGHRSNSFSPKIVEQLLETSTFLESIFERLCTIDELEKQIFLKICLM